MNVHPKVMTSSLAGAVTVLLVWGLSFAKIQIPPEVASAITALISLIVGYMVPSGGGVVPPQDPAR